MSLYEIWLINTCYIIAYRNSKQHIKNGILNKITGMMPWNVRGHVMLCMCVNSKLWKILYGTARTSGQFLLHCYHYNSWKIFAKKYYLKNYTTAFNTLPRPFPGVQYHLRKKTLTVDVPSSAICSNEIFSRLMVSGKQKIKNI